MLQACMHRIIGKTCLHIPAAGLVGFFFFSFLLNNAYISILFVVCVYRGLV